MTGDERAARLLAGEKEVFRNMETETTDAHFERLRAGRLDTAETSTLHLDALRDLKNVNTHLVAAALLIVLANCDTFRWRAYLSCSAFVKSAACASRSPKGVRPQRVSMSLRIDVVS